MNNFRPKELKVLVIGATGAGKSSLINLFQYWSTNQPLAHLYSTRRALIKTKFFEGDGEAEGNVTQQGESQTHFAKLYTFNVRAPGSNIEYELSFLDTPGIGDTRGTERDEQNIQLIMDSVAKTEDLNAIILVLNGSDSRISPRVRYIVNKLKAFIPTSLNQNLMVLLSNVDLKPNMDVKRLLDFPIDDSRIFYYNNQAFNLDPIHFSNKNLLNRVEQGYGDVIETLSAMLKQISILPAVKTVDFEEIKLSQDVLKKELNTCREMICKILKKKSEMEKLFPDIKEDKIEISKLQKELGQEVEEIDWEVIATPYVNTVCQTCRHACHEQCGLDIKVPGGVAFKNCYAFFSKGKNKDDSYCKECGHHYDSHIHIKEKYKKFTHKTQKHHKNIKNAMKNQDNEKAVKIYLTEQLNYQIDEMNEKIELLKEKIIMKILEMREVCSRFDYIKQIDSCINIIREQENDLLNKQTPSVDDICYAQILHESEDFMQELKQQVIETLKKAQTQSSEQAQNFRQHIQNELQRIDERLEEKEKPQKIYTSEYHGMPPAQKSSYVTSEESKRAEKTNISSYQKRQNLDDKTSQTLEGVDNKSIKLSGNSYDQQSQDRSKQKPEYSCSEDKDKRREAAGLTFENKKKILESQIFSLVRDLVEFRNEYNAEEEAQFFVNSFNAMSSSMLKPKEQNGINHIHQADQVKRESAKEAPVSKENAEFKNDEEDAKHKVKPEQEPKKNIFQRMLGW